MALTEAQLKARDGKVTASFAPYLMAGDRDRILSEWMRLVGHPDYAPEDLSDKWPVQFGSYIETFAVNWHERKTGQALTRRGEVVVHPEFPFVCCTLDAYREADGMVLDCKALGNWRKIEEACSFYLPQVIIQRDCIPAKSAGLLIVHGGSEPQEYPLAITDDYSAQVWHRIHLFWRCVEDLTPPVEMPTIVAPVPAVREYDFDRNNEWASHAGAWRETRTAARSFEIAAKAIKKLVPPDAARCFGHSIEVTRNRAGALSIAEVK